MFRIQLTDEQRRLFDDDMNVDEMVTEERFCFHFPRGVGRRRK